MRRTWVFRSSLRRWQVPFEPYSCRQGTCREFLRDDALFLQSDPERWPFPEEQWYPDESLASVGLRLNRHIHAIPQEPIELTSESSVRPRPIHRAEGSDQPADSILEQIMGTW